MKRTTYAILAGSLAFGLTAAAAAGISFTIGSLDPLPGTTSDTESISTTACDGTYAITWTYDSTGYVTAFQATRTAPDPDPNGKFCKSVPAYISIEQGLGSVISSYSGTTSSAGDFSGTFTTPFIAAEGNTVFLQIGPEAYGGI